MRMLLFVWGLVGASFCLFDGGVAADPAKMQRPVEVGFDGLETRPPVEVGFDGPEISRPSEVGFDGPEIRQPVKMGFEEAVVLLSGASCIEDLSEEEMLRWESLASHPVNLNVAGRSRLISSGLFTQFQVVSLLDYRGRTGAVLSWSELALVDGFSPEIVSALRVFATLGVEVAGGSGKGAGAGSSAGGSAGGGMGIGSGPGGAFVPGRRESLRVGGSVTAKGAGRVSVASAREGASGGGNPGRFSEATLAGGVKLELAAGERAVLYSSIRNTLSDTRFSSPTFSAAYYGKQALGQVVIGHFQARFGQGLVLWSGFRMSGYSSVGAFRRNGNGFSPTGSYSPTLLGVATDWHFGAWRLSLGYSFGGSWEEIAAMAAGGSTTATGGKTGAAGGAAGGAENGFWQRFGAFWAGGLPIGNLTWTGRTVTLGLTATSKAAGFEARWSLPGGWGLFGEVATNWAAVGTGNSGSATGAAGTGGPGDAGTSEFGNWLRSLSAVAGAVRVPSYGHKWALLARWFGPGSKEYSGLALGYAGPSLEATLDAGVKGLGAVRAEASGQSGGAALARWLAAGEQMQIKAVAQWKPVFELSAGDAFRLSPQLRVVARWRPEEVPASQTKAAAVPSAMATSPAPTSPPAVPLGLPCLRLELRGVLAAESGPWLLAGRYDAVWYRGFAWNWYAEAGFRADALKVWLRGGIFKVDEWDDRIYVYERDAPGSFTVPARYGRGWNASLYATWKLHARHSIWLRIETVEYPWNLSPKEGRVEARLQYRWKF